MNTESLACSNLTFTPTDNRRLAQLCGQFDENLRLLENYLDVEISFRGNLFKIVGDSQAVDSTKKILNSLYAETAGQGHINPAKIHLLLQQSNNHKPDETKLAKFNSMKIRTKLLHITPRSPNQAKYVESILNHDINFAIGPAGTGKTYLAVALAVEALEKEKVNRILLVRPAVEAGERLGFLPGDLSQKVDPYLRPLYDALYEMLGFEKVTKLIEKNVIEIAPLAYMRGRTLNDSFIILDEGQNTTKEQMKMFLTRIGFGSICVITGDVTQIDLPNDTLSGLIHAMRVLKKVKGISTTEFQAKDVVRHPLVQQIVTAYADHENKQEKKS